MPSLTLRTEHITLAQALKASGQVETGGQAKLLVRNGDVAVNGVIVTQPGKKLLAGDRFRLGDEPEWTVTASNERP